MYNEPCWWIFSYINWSPCSVAFVLYRNCDIAKLGVETKLRCNCYWIYPKRHCSTHSVELWWCVFIIAECTVFACGLVLKPCQASLLLFCWLHPTLLKKCVRCRIVCQRWVCKPCLMRQNLCALLKWVHLTWRGKIWKVDQQQACSLILAYRSDIQICLLRNTSYCPVLDCATYYNHSFYWHYFLSIASTYKNYHSSED